MHTLTIATRGSRLALWQAEHVAGLIRGLTSDITISIKTIKTRGDIVSDTPLSKIDGKGLFIKEIEEAILAGQADIAVHSMKDLPSELPSGMTIGMIPARDDPADVLLSGHTRGLSALSSGSIIGTSSPRRQAQLLAIRPDIRVVSVRGNVDTRLRKLREGMFDALVMAAAGLKRLNLDAPYMERLQPTGFLPAVGQGALGVEFAEDRRDLAELLAPLDDPATRVCIEAERGVLAGLGGGCQVPMAAYAMLQKDGCLVLQGLVAHPDGSIVVRKHASSAPGITSTAARALGLAMANEILEAGGRSILNTVYYMSM